MRIKGQQSLPLGIVVERREVAHRWVKHSWRPVAVIPGAGAADPLGPWTELGEGEGWRHYHAGTLTLDLFPKETEGYRVNMAQQPPRLFVVLRSGEDMAGADIICDHDVAPFLVTACPFEAQDYLDSGEEIVEAVAMPPGVAALVESFIAEHHVEEAFHKRKRKRWAEQTGGIARRSSVVSADGAGGSGRGEHND